MKSVAGQSVHFATQTAAFALFACSGAEASAARSAKCEKTNVLLLAIYLYRCKPITATIRQNTSDL